MNIPRRLGVAMLATTALMLTLAASPALAANHHRHGFFDFQQHAVFVQNDNPNGNAIAVYDRERGGQLAAAGVYATGGKGGILAGSVVDHLASQSSLVYDSGSHLLFAVNAGSDSVSVFSVNDDRLALRQVTSSGGSFPVSVAIHGDLVYVLNALGGGNVAGYRIVGDQLVRIPGSERTLGLDPDATPQYVTTPGDVAFTPDGRQLIITTKDNGNDIDVYAVDSLGLLSATPVVNGEPGTVPFALAFEGENQVAVGEAGTDAVASFALTAGGTLRQLSSVATGQQATCWLVADGAALFAGNAGSGTESTILLDSPFGALTLNATTSTDMGTVDAAVTSDGRYLYVQTGAAGIVDEFAVGFDATLREIGSVTVAGAVGGEGIATS